MSDYADFEIIAELESPDDTVRQIKVRFIAEIDGVGYLQDDIIMTYPKDIDTASKLGEHIVSINLSNWFEALKYVPEIMTECPTDGTPLQHGECMVCGFKAVI